MAYITAKELRAVVPDEYRDAALSDSGARPDPGLLQAVIEAACQEVDSLIEGRVNLPLSTPYPQKIRTAARYFALEILFTRRGVEMPDATARKIAGIRSDLGKVGAGDLRLEAPAEQTAASRAASGSIVVRPSITGTGGMIGAVLFLLSTLVRPAPAIDARTFTFTATTNPMVESPDFVEWSQGESFGLRYILPAADGAREVRWEISDPTNLWLNMAPVRSGAVWSWNPAPTQTCLAPGRYEGRVAVYERSGTNLAFHRILAWQDIRVHPARDPRTLIEASPLVHVGGETDPVFSALGITTVLMAQWSQAFGWGNHRTNGYLTSAATTSDLPNIPWMDFVGGSVPPSASSFRVNGISNAVWICAGSGVHVRVVGSNIYIDVTNTPGGSGTISNVFLNGIAGTNSGGAAYLSFEQAPNPYYGLPSVVVTGVYTVTSTVYAVGADTATTNAIISLADLGTNFSSVVIRKFGNTNTLMVMRGTNISWTLHDDGSAVAYDWWPARTNWFWRASP